MKFPPEVLRDDSSRSFHLSLAIVKYFLGEAWIDKHIDPEGDTPSFLRLTLEDTESTNAQVQLFRIVDLAELFYNLQRVDGFDACITRMRDGAIEATYAELDFGRMLYTDDVSFRFVVPQQKLGMDYDIEITCKDGVVVCADAKCKVESTEYSKETVRNSLDKARKQFPPDRPSAIFVKVPSGWITELNLTGALMDIAHEFFRGTQRVVSVKYYSADLKYTSGEMLHIHAFKEVSNPNNRFNRLRDWDMFTSPDATGNDGFHKMPPRWKRVLNFPKGLYETEAE